MYLKSGKLTSNIKSKSTRCSKMSPVTETIIKKVMIVLYIYITVTIRTFTDIFTVWFRYFSWTLPPPLWGSDLVVNGAGFPFNTKTGRWLFFQSKTEKQSRMLLWSSATSHSHWGHLLTAITVGLKTPELLNDFILNNYQSDSRCCQIHSESKDIETSIETQPTPAAVLPQGTNEVIFKEVFVEAHSQP